MKKIISFVITVCIFCSLFIITVSANTCECGNCVSNSMIFRATARMSFVDNGDEAFPLQGNSLKVCHSTSADMVNDSNDKPVLVRPYATVNISRLYISSAGNWYYITSPEDGFAQGWVPAHYLHDIKELTKNVGET